MISQPQKPIVAAFSATYNDQSERKWFKALQNPVKLFAGQGESFVDNESTKIIPKNIQVNNILIEHKETIDLTLQDKLKALTEILTGTDNTEGQVLIFHNYKSHAVEIQKYIRVNMKVLSVYLNSE